MEEIKSTKSTLTRRGFLKTSAVAAGAVAAAGAVGAPLVALAEGEKQQSSGDKIGYSVCRGNCGSRCPMKVEIREGKVVRTSAAVLEDQDNAN